MNYLTLCTVEELAEVTAERAGETKSGQSMQVLDASRLHAGQLDYETLQAELKAARQRGNKFAVLGIPEDITPRANLGRGGADGAWASFLRSWCNLQDNRFWDCASVLLLGCVDCRDLQERSTRADVETLRGLCAELDQRVEAAVTAVVSAGLIPVVIGGGHGGAWGIGKGAAAGLLRLREGIAVVNCDPHGDYRALEGRHSGNAFSYAGQAGWLKRYHVLGMHESYNSESMLQRMSGGGASWITFEDIFVRCRTSWEEALRTSAEMLRETGLPVGIEVDMDSIADMPSSAVLPYGLTLREAARFVHYMASCLPYVYLHLAEAAPSLGSDGERRTGRGLAWLASVFVKAAADNSRIML